MEIGNESGGSPNPPLSPHRLADLHRAMNTHMKASSVAQTPEEEAGPGVGLGAWLPGTMDMRGGKKGDILKVVSEPKSYVYPVPKAICMLPLQLLHVYPL